MPPFQRAIISFTSLCPAFCRAVIFSIIILMMVWLFKTDTHRYLVTENPKLEAPAIPQVNVRPLIEIPRSTLRITPFPYAVVEDALDAGYFAQLEKDFPPFPTSEPAQKSGYIGQKSIQYNSPEYLHLLKRSSAWKALHDFVSSQAVVDLGMRVYGDLIKSDPNCLLDPENLVYEPYHEDVERVRKDIDAIIKQRKSPVNKVFSRMDFFHGLPEKYALHPHLDWPHRIFSMLIYFSTTNSSTGGEYIAYQQQPDGKFIVQEIYPTKPNLLLSHMSCSPKSWHGVSPFNGPGMRKLIQIQISAHHSVCRTKATEKH